MDKIIENNVPIPSISNKANSKHDLHLIGEGQSCLYSGTKKELATIRVCAINYAKRHKISMVTRMLSEGLRVWHVKNSDVKKIAERPLSPIAAMLQAKGVQPHDPWEK